MMVGVHQAGGDDAVIGSEHPPGLGGWRRPADGNHETLVYGHPTPLQLTRWSHRYDDFGPLDDQVDGRCYHRRRARVALVFVFGRSGSVPTERTATREPLRACSLATASAWVASPLDMALSRATWAR